MALQHLDLEENLRPLSDLRGYDVEKGDIDPRDWPVVTTDGTRVGTVNDLIVDTRSMKARYLVVDLDGNHASEGDSTVLLDVASANIRRDRHDVVASTFRDMAQGSAAGFYSYRRPDRRIDREATDTSGDRMRMTRSEEELQVDKREVPAGEVRVGKHVETEHVRQPVTTRREEVYVERRPISADARADASIGDDEIRVPVMAEEVVVDKRAVPKEELIVGKRLVEEKEIVEDDVRREEFDIDDKARIGPGERKPGRGDV